MYRVYRVSVTTSAEARVRHLSKIVFGQEWRLSVMLAIARHHDGIFCLTDIAEAVGARNVSSVQVPLKSLVEAGLVHRQEALSGEKHRWYSRGDSAAWRFAEELAELAASLGMNS